jgi:ataxia telangiectasia mutated family protein
LKKLAIEHPYHTMYQLLALSNGDRVKDNQRGKTSFVVDLEKKHAAEDLLMSLTTHHRQLLTQMKQMVEIYIRLAELETTKEVQLITGLAILFIGVGSCLPLILI